MGDDLVCVVFVLIFVAVELCTAEYVISMARK